MNIFSRLKQLITRQPAVIEPVVRDFEAERIQNEILAMSDSVSRQIAAIKYSKDFNIVFSARIENPVIVSRKAKRVEQKTPSFDMNYLNNLSDRFHDSVVAHENTLQFFERLV